MEGVRLTLEWKQTSLLQLCHHAAKSSWQSVVKFNRNLIERRKWLFTHEDVLKERPFVAFDIHLEDVNVRMSKALHDRLQSMHRDRCILHDDLGVDSA